jgi:hypothetical protein
MVGYANEALERENFHDDEILLIMGTGSDITE